jgi:sortase A
LEWLTLVAGLVLLAVFGVAMIHRSAGSRLALAYFEPGQVSTPSASAEGPLDFSLWSAKRIRSYRESLNLLQGNPMAVLAIDRLQIKAPVFAGTDELVLNRGVGWIPGTAKPGESGNSGIAGHRDGFFRALKDVAAGDAVEIRARSTRFVYRVDGIEIVFPENVGVLRPRGVDSLTLVTCYPFYFAGDAPQRFVVKAKLVKQVATNVVREGGSSGK